MEVWEGPVLVWEGPVEIWEDPMFFLLAKSKASYWTLGLLMTPILLFYFRSAVILPFSLLKKGICWSSCCHSWVSYMEFSLTLWLS